MAKHWLDKYGALKRLQQFDLEQEKSLVREIEMAVDGFPVHRLRVVQFFQDFQVYGFSEAITYMEEVLGTKELGLLKKMREKVLEEVR